MTKTSETLQERRRLVGVPSSANMGECMRNNLFIVLVSVLTLFSGCNRQQQPAQQTQQTNQPAPEYDTTNTVKDIMDGIVDPSADFIWDSVATIVSANGTDE